MNGLIVIPIILGFACLCVAIVALSEIDEDDE